MTSATKPKATNLDPATRAGPPSSHDAALPFASLPATIQPDRALLRYYALSSLLLGPAFIVGLLIGYARYRTLRYEVDAEGISMRWGLLFRREVSLNYARIQDIQLSSNAVERWLGLAKIQLQTASGSADAEMTIEGVPAVDAMRDFLYGRMRGAAGGQRPETRSATSSSNAALANAAQSGSVDDELIRTLLLVAEELRALRLAQAGDQTVSEDFADSTPDGEPAR
jgi:membrane protein YdbS with pleckstrin-like domain